MKVSDRALSLLTSLRLICAVYAVVLIVLCVFLVRQAPALWSSLLWGAFGLLLVTLLEYLIHRFLFHRRQPAKFYVQIHQRHHRVPERQIHGVVPVHDSLMILLICGGGFWIASQSFSACLAFLIGLSCGYLLHETTHYRSHHRLAITRVGRFLQATHHVHHYVDHAKNYGFIVPVWDMVFGTYRSPERSSTGGYTYAVPAKER